MIVSLLDFTALDSMPARLSYAPNFADPGSLRCPLIRLLAYLLAGMIVHLALSPLVSQLATVWPLPSRERYRSWVVKCLAWPLCAANAIAFVGRTRMRAL